MKKIIITLKEWRNMMKLLIGHTFTYAFVGNNIEIEADAGYLTELGFD